MHPSNCTLVNLLANICRITFGGFRQIDLQVLKVTLVLFITSAYSSSTMALDQQFYSKPNKWGVKLYNGCRGVALGGSSILKKNSHFLALQLRK
jgi:hypothetical protein